MKINIEEQTQEELQKIHKRLVISRSTRMTIMMYLLSALIFTAIYGTLENPFQYSFSKIGNRFNPTLRVLFIVWASYTGFAIQTTIIALFSLERYKKKRHYTFIITAVLFLFLSAIAPSIDHLPFWTWVHIITAGLFGFFISLGFIPFMRWIARENPRLRRIMYAWMGIIWVGSFAFMFILGNTGVFELWFFGSFILFLLYLSLTLFEEEIVKESVMLLRNEEDLNDAIERYFVRQKQKTKKDKK